ncbi:MAG: SsrA-binding protein SmpB [Microscillaceae bacterium]|nr:SsrA-binding protein SmpB [Microscillaceae bacterium]MDW8461440.1 SsrA-binding protein SmpB [Cytophagales bacterium]
MTKLKDKMNQSVNIQNRQARFEYEFLENYTAGIMLTGTEIKSIRQAKVQLQDSFCYFKDMKSLWVKNMHIAPYENGTHYNHEPRRERKLLLTKKELRKLFHKHQEKGLTIIPVRLFINERGLAKLEIALARGKKLYDKRETIKERDVRREMARDEY